MAAHKSIFYHLERDPHRVQAAERSSPEACMNSSREQPSTAEPLTSPEELTAFILEPLRNLIRKVPTVRHAILVPIQLFCLGLYAYAVFFKMDVGVYGRSAWLTASLVALGVLFFSRYIQEDREDNWRAWDEKQANVQARMGERWNDRAIRRARKRRGLL